MAASIDELKQQVQALALEAAGKSSPLALLARLTELRQNAEQAGHSELASAATRFEAALKQMSAAGDLARLALILELGVEELQQIVETGHPAAQAPKAAVNQLALDPELLSDFIVESRDHLTTIEKQVLALEQNPGDSEAIHSIFRGFHTIKGLAGFLELPAIQEVAHEVETVLDHARNGELAITPAVIDVILAGADYLKRGTDAVELSLGENQPAQIVKDPALLDRIRALMEKQAQTESAPSPDSEPQQNPVAESKRTVAPAAGSVKVDTTKLDYLVEMVGELVIAQSMVRHDPQLTALQSPRLTGNLSQLTRITSEVQKLSMAMRMVAVEQLFHRTARLVRDLSRKSNKRVELQTSGEDTELDRTLIEELADPLMHMVRNSIDHGIEPEAERVRAGKSPAGHIHLKAFHQGGYIAIEIADDGRGLDREKISRKAYERGLVREGDVLSDAEVFALIFEPGFSTADKVTDISGRGVGMDVVRKQLQKLRGRIETESKTGEGTCFRLKLPLTLAIIDGLVVTTGPERYIVPLFAVREMLRPTSEMISTIEGRHEMAMVRGTLLPIVRLHQKFNVQPRSEDPCQSLLVVAESAGKVFCLMVDDLVGRQEVVIKSLGEAIKNIPGVSGGAILGDGRVGLILDLEGLYGERKGA